VIKIAYYAKELIIFMARSCVSNFKHSLQQAPSVATMIRGENSREIFMPFAISSASKIFGQMFSRIYGEKIANRLSYNAMLCRQFASRKP
jgi:hypothetical protein